MAFLFDDPRNEFPLDERVWCTGLVCAVMCVWRRKVAIADRERTCSHYLVEPAGGIRRSWRVCADDFTSAKDSAGLQCENEYIEPWDIV